MYVFVKHIAQHLFLFRARDPTLVNALRTSPVSLDALEDEDDE